MVYATGLVTSIRERSEDEAETWNMAKTYLRHYVITLNDVLDAYTEWSNGESGKKNQHRVIEEYGSVNALVFEVYSEIKSRTLTFRPIYRYPRREPTNGKIRIIGIESIKQQICDYLVVTLLEPLYHAKIGFYQVASVKGKGQKLCQSALRRWVRDARYHVKGDVKKCYPSTSHRVVMAMYRKLVGSDDVLYVISTLLATYTCGGLEIGSYFSLRTMQLVLSYGYHHIESLHKTRRGLSVPLVTHQIWHMDDILLIGTDKRNLKMAIRSLERYMWREFGLKIKPWKVAKTSKREPLDLGGWVVRAYKCREDRYRATLRGGTFLRGTRSFRRFRRCPSPAHAKRCSSYWGWLYHSDSDTLIRNKKLGATFAHARSVSSRADRLEAQNATNTVGHTARGCEDRAARRGHRRMAATPHRSRLAR